MAAIQPARDRQLPSRSDLIASVARDLVSVVSLGVLLSCIHEFAPPFRRGFHCDDETIRYPYKDSTVPSSVCYLVGSGVNVILILVVEYYNLISAARNATDDGSDESATRRESGVDKFQVKLYLENVYSRLIVWFFGSISCELITDITKVTAGRLRPHFIDVCDPVMRSATGERNITEYCLQTRNPYEYITNYYCTGDPAKQRDARLSFLSGHSSYSAYSATFAIFYIQSSVDITNVGLLKPALQILIASAAFYTGLTRVSDYKHHWQDVLAGLVLGTAVATLVSIYVWPSVKKTYVRFTRALSQRTDSNHAGEELNRFSY